MELYGDMEHPDFSLNCEESAKHLESIRRKFHIENIPVWLRKQQVELLHTYMHDDFEWDSIICVIGHSDIRYRNLKPSHYSALGDLKVVTVYGTRIGTSCFTFTKHVRTMFDWLERRLKTHELTPTDVAIALNTMLRERDPTLVKTLKDEEAVEFLESGVKISPSVDTYFDKEWEFYHKEKGVYKHAGSILLYKTDILKKAVEAGCRRPLFIDLGCNTFAGTKSARIWKEIKNKTGHIGGRLTKRPKVKKLIHFT